MRFVRATRAAPLLFAVAFYDELASGMPTAGAADVVADLHLGATGYAMAVFAVPWLVAIVVETPLLAWSDRRRHMRPKLVALGLLGLAAGLLVTAHAHTAWALSLGVALYGPMIGLSTSLAEGMLVDDATASGDRSAVERTMARWTLWGALGDATTPLVLAAASATLGWRAALEATALLLAVTAPFLAAVPALAHTRDGDDDDDDDDNNAPLVASVRVALRNRALMAWLFATALCTLLDETLVALAGLWSRDRFGSAVSTALLVALSTGGAVGLLVLERVLVRRSPRAVLLTTSMACAASFTLMLVSARFGPAAAVAFTFVAGAFAAPLYPLAKAAAYRALPGQSGVVNAAGQAFAVVDLIAPVLLGLAADRFGVVAALACLLVQPVVTAVFAAVSLTATSTPPAQPRRASAEAPTTLATPTPPGGTPSPRPQRRDR